MSLTIASAAFANDAAIPVQYTCEGKAAMPGHVLVQATLVGTYKKMPQPSRSVSRAADDAPDNCRQSLQFAETAST